MHPEHLATVMETIADTLLAVPALRSEHECVFARDALVARIAYSGAFEGALVATFSDRLAHALAGLMMGRSSAACSDADARDAVGEITNIAAGNLRGLLAEGCRLSLPSVSTLASVQAQEQPPLLARVEFWLFDQPLRLELRGALRA